MTDVAQETPQLSVQITRNHVYIDATSFDTHLARVANVALLRDGNNLLILPIVGAEAGGFFVKQVNARGDRAIHAADFFWLHGIDETSERHVAATWIEGLAGFTVRDFFVGEPVELTARKQAGL